MTRPLVVCCAAALLAALPSLASAAEKPEGRLVSFSVQREAQVENDRVTISLTATEEDSDATKAAQRVNQTMAWALAKAKAQPAVTARTTAYQSYPVSDDGKIRRWRVIQTLELEGASADALSPLVGTLQEKLQVSAMSFWVSPEKRRAAEDQLITQALAAVNARAEAIRKALGAKGQQLVQARIGTADGFPQPPMPMAKGMMMASEAMAPAAMEPGSSQVAVTIEATISLE